MLAVLSCCGPRKHERRSSAGEGTTPQPRPQTAPKSSEPAAASTAHSRAPVTCKRTARLSNTLVSGLDSIAPVSAANHLAARTPPAHEATRLPEEILRAGLQAVCLDGRRGPGSWPRSHRVRPLFAIRIGHRADDLLKRFCRRDWRDRIVDVAVLAMLQVRDAVFLSRRQTAEVSQVIRSYCADSRSVALPLAFEVLLFSPGASSFCIAEAALSDAPSDDVRRAWRHRVRQRIAAAETLPLTGRHCLEDVLFAGRLRLLEETDRLARAAQIYAASTFLSRLCQLCLSDLRNVSRRGLTEGLSLAALPEALAQYRRRMIRLFPNESLAIDFRVDSADRLLTAASAPQGEHFTASAVPQGHGEKGGASASTVPS